MSSEASGSADKEVVTVPVPVPGIQQEKEVPFSAKPKKVPVPVPGIQQERSLNRQASERNVQISEQVVEVPHTTEQEFVKKPARKSVATISSKSASSSSSSETLLPASPALKQKRDDESKGNEDLIDPEDIRIKDEDAVRKEAAVDNAKFIGSEVCSCLGGCAWVLALLIALGLLFFMIGTWLWVEAEFAKPFLEPAQESTLTKYFNEQLHAGAELSPNTVVKEQLESSAMCVYQREEAKHLGDQVAEYNRAHGWREVVFSTRAHDDFNPVNVTAYYYESVAGTKSSPTVIVQHDAKSNALDEAVVVVAFFLRKAGYNVLTPKLNEGPFKDGGQDGVRNYALWLTEGAYALLGAYDYLLTDPDGGFNGMKEPSEVGLMGFGRGAYIAKVAFGLEPRIPGLLSDGGVQDSKEQLKYLINQRTGKVFNLGTYIVNSAWAKCVQLAGSAIDELTPRLTMATHPEKRKLAAFHAVDDVVVPAKQTDSFLKDAQEGPDYEVVLVWVDDRAQPTPAVQQRLGGSQCKTHERLQVAHPYKYDAKICTFFKDVFGRKDAVCPRLGDEDQAFGVSQRTEVQDNNTDSAEDDDHATSALQLHSEHEFIDDPAEAAEITPTRRALRNLSSSMENDLRVLRRTASPMSKAQRAEEEQGLEPVSLESEAQKVSNQQQIQAATLSKEEAQEVEAAKKSIAKLSADLAQDLESLRRLQAVQRAGETAASLVHPGTLSAATWPIDVSAREPP